MINEKVSKFLSKERYISKPELCAYLEVCGVKLNEDILQELACHNEKFVKEELAKNKEYFDHLYDDTTSKVLLDEEQRKVILFDESYALVNAGAGSGKSTTIAAKAKYLVDKKGVLPEEICMLSYTKTSADDLEQKVTELVGDKVSVSTFHSLGMNILRNLYDYPLKVASETLQKEIITEYIMQKFADKEAMQKIIESFPPLSYGKYLPATNFFSKGFVTNFSKFSTFDEYFADYKNRKYEKESKKSEGIHGYIKFRVKANMENMKDIMGKRCKSIGEINISNYLYFNGLNYTYEEMLEEKVDEGKSYSPDFAVYANGKKIYIEYFGLSGCYKNGETIPKKIAMYNKIRKKKEEFQKAHPEYLYINLDYKKEENGEIIYYLKDLDVQLKKLGVALKPQEDKYIFNDIMDQNLSSEFFFFVDLMLKFIGNLKDMLVEDIDVFFGEVKERISKDKVYFNYYSSNVDEERRKRIQALDVLKEVYVYYTEYLVKNHMIDYADMINKTYKYITTNRYNGFKFKYVIVDEYQDITYQRYLFVKALVDYYNAKLVSVGDDWQSIYSFQGARVELFTKFNEYFEHADDSLGLNSTHRYSQELADISSKFVQRNNKLTKKTLVSDKHLDKPVQVIRHAKHSEEFGVIYDLVKKLYEENPDKEILLLARRNRDIQELLESGWFKAGVDDEVRVNGMPNARVRILTMHSSKGVTADQVIVFRLYERIFPSKGLKMHWIFDYFKMDNLNRNEKREEEARLFYVALTRTRTKVYLVVPSEDVATSFVEKLGLE